MVAFGVKKLRSLMLSHVFIFAFVFLVWGGIPEQVLLRAVSDILLPVLSPRSVTGSSVTLLINPFWVYSCISCKKVVSSCFFYTHLSSFPKAIFWIDNLSHHTFLLPVSNINWSCRCGLFLGSPSNSIGLYVCLYASPMLLRSLGTCGIDWYQAPNASTSVLLSQGRWG